MYCSLFNDLELHLTYKAMLHGETFWKSAQNMAALQFCVVALVPTHLFGCHHQWCLAKGISSIWISSSFQHHPQQFMGASTNECGNSGQETVDN